MQPSVQRFCDDLNELGLEPLVEGDLVVYRVTPVDGARAGTPLETGVSVDDLNSWPQAPPHWVHLPTDVQFPRTNSQPSSKPGWVMHSRQIASWNDAPPGSGWASHVRAVLSEATA